MTLRLGVLVLVTSLAGMRAVPAQDAPSIRTTLDTAVIHVGDRLRLTVDVTHAASERVVWPDSLTLDPFEVLDLELGEPVTAGERITSSLVLTLTAFELGELELPSFDVTVEDGEPRTLRTDGWTVTVESVGLDEGGDIRDVKGPLSMARNWWLLWPWVVGALALTALALWSYRRYQRRARPAAPARRTPIRPPHEIALDALMRLEQERLLDRGDIKPFHIRISEILRVYFEGRYGIDAMELVTDEVVVGLRGAGADDDHVETARAFLEACDLVKFAKHTPAPEASREMVPAARRLVEATQPRPAPVEASAA